MGAPQTDVLSIKEIAIDDSEDLGSIAFVTIDRPDKLNALNAEVMSSLKDMVAWVEQTDSIRVVVITGAQPNEPEQGKRAKPNAFVAGADITEFVGKKSDDIRVMFADNAVEALWNISKPTIAMVDGFALGGGCEVACSCDIRIASNRSRFGTPEINLGLIPGYGATQRLVNLLGYGKTMEMVMTGEMIDSTDALKWGLVNHVVEPEQLFDFTMNLAKVIGSKSTHTLKVAKKTIRSALSTGLEQGVAIEAEAFASLFDSEDKEIGVAAFIGRHQAKWQHK
ncbi:MAG: enoyl-CoA hydratase/isomerase family protein [Euryarchaeota archaeon]|jgi:enoyl-CoA hydratase|nr:enoyl-CoA hydratase/isomerase family protein [Euryarchaeota archaeon]MBT5254979.1 enoyl-CoA hydratase/isomerase family protein [Euryarchaeota archaeon]MDG1546491.1 enoyl-CoA hydratase/isomerase family protein [Candidatus Poseidoniaceae archaeon]